MDDDPHAATPRRLTAHALTLDVAAAEVIRALQEARIDPILLKGPALVSWLYDDGGLRGYGDIDLLVAPHDLRAAHRVLEQRGFRYGERGTDDIDLVDTIGGPKLPPGEVWTLLDRRTQPFRLLDVDVRVLDECAQAAHVVVHAWKHGYEMAVPLEDLRRLLARIPNDAWPEVLKFVRELDAMEAFAGGLALLPGGVAIAERLGLSVEPSTETLLLREQSPPQLLLLDRAFTARGWRRRLTLLRAAFAPHPDEMRLRFAFARRGRRGLAAAYVVRSLRLAVTAPAALLVWKRARQRAANRG